MAPHLCPHAHLHLVERSAAAREAQRVDARAVAGRGPLTATELPATFEGVIVANELLDAMPVHQVVMREMGLDEVYVDRTATAWSRAKVRSPHPPSAHTFRRPASTWPRGRARRCRSRPSTGCARRPGGSRRGFMILIDYGHEARALYSEARASGTLTLTGGHRFAGGDTGAPWLEHPGRAGHHRARRLHERAGRGRS